MSQSSEGPRIKRPPQAFVRFRVAVAYHSEGCEGWSGDREYKQRGRAESLCQSQLD
jgi:hypothetical protein